MGAWSMIKRVACGRHDVNRSGDAKELCYKVLPRLKVEFQLIPQALLFCYAQETARAVEAEGRRCVLVPGDVKDPEFCREAVEQTVEEFGHLDILVNNAAFQQHQESIEDISEEQ
jgi:NAD(P)-dependent dehydrogenase (short-subunit alcohol dehydrogenase family)